MQDLSLFNIGFRCEGICEGLRRYKADGNPLTPRMFEESMQVIEDCFSFRSNMASFFSANRAGLTEFLPLVFELFPGSTPDKIIDHLRKAQSTLERIGKGESSIEIEDVLELFKKISALCLRRNAVTNSNFPSIFSLAV